MRLSLTLLVVAGVLLAGCARPDEESPDVVASFYPLAFLAETLVGGDLRVETLVPPGVEPHDYEPTARDVLRAREAKVILVQGAGFETWIETVAGDAPTARFVVATGGLPLREGAHEEDHGEEEGEEVDPHTWLDPRLFAESSRLVEQALIEEFPGRAGGLRERGEALRASLAELDADVAAGLADCESRAFVTTHAAFGYFADRYNLTMISISGLDPEAEPTPGAVQAAIDAAREHNATTIYFEELVSPRVAEVVAKEVGATTRVLSPVEGISPEDAAAGATYLTRMRDNLVALREGLRCA